MKNCCQVSEVEVTSDIRPFLEATRGRQATLSDYGDSGQRLALRLTAPSEEDLYVLCLSIKHIHAPVRWEDSQLEIEQPDPEGPARLFDRRNDVEILCSEVLGITSHGGAYDCCGGSAEI